MADAGAPDARATSWSRDIRAALRRLDPTQRTIIQMIYFERCTQQQVAERLRLPGPTVSRAMAAGLQRLAALVLAQASG